MSIKLFNGLVAVGDILTETYYRKTRATTEAKNDLGFTSEQEPNASLGIAQIDEYVVMSASNILRTQDVVFDLSQFDQDLKLCSMYIDNANTDAVIFKVRATVPTPSGSTTEVDILTQTFNRNKTPVSFPDAPLPPNVKLVVTAKSDIAYLQLAFKACSIIATADGVVEGA